MDKKVARTVFPVHEQAPPVQAAAGCGSYSEAAQPQPLLWFNPSQQSSPMQLPCQWDQGVKARGVKAREVKVRSVRAEKLIG